MSTAEPLLITDNCSMTPINVIGIGLDGAAGLSPSALQLVKEATLLVGSNRHLSYFPNLPAEHLLLDDFTQVIRVVKNRLERESIAILVTGDPLFFGLGRLLLAELPPEQLRFHPHVSSIQLAFSRVKVPWNDARIISTHGRSLDELTDALRQGVNKIAILTDQTNNPSAIARLLLALDLPSFYQFWVCENLGTPEEQVRLLSPETVLHQRFAPLNVAILLRQQGTESQSLNLSELPQFGLPDGTFLSFSDRPGLMTKREVRLLVLGELALQPAQVIWDIGSGTGSVAIEIARLFPTSIVYAVEKTAAGTTLIEQNSLRFQVTNLVSIHGSAPEILHHLPTPNRIFIGGTGGNLPLILGTCGAALIPNGVLVMAIVTLEHLHEATSWMGDRGWTYRLLQVQLSRSLPISGLTRFSPLNPVTILTATRS